MTFRKLSVRMSLLCALAFVVSEAVSAAEPAEALIIVAGTAFPASDISFAALKSAFRGQRITVGGKTIVPINHPLDSRTRVAFDRVALGLTPEAVGPFWVDMRIRDQGRPPTTASTPELAIRIASALAGAVTYASPSAPRKWPVKVLTVEGRAAGQPGYPLNP